jgi:hypothetical protein
MARYFSSILTVESKLFPNSIYNSIKNIGSGSVK